MPRQICWSASSHSLLPHFSIFLAYQNSWQNFRTALKFSLLEKKYSGLMVEILIQKKKED